MATQTATATMKAVQVHEFGDADRLIYEDVPRPEPGAGELLVRVHAAGVNPVDWKIREGLLRDWVQLPVVLGQDIAGVVESVGAGASGFKPGDEVFAFAASKRGGYAEYAVVTTEEAAPKPRSLDFVKAAAVPVAAMTAWQALFDVGGLSAGQKVLIHAAAGGVGSFAVQFARVEGAHAIGTASAANLDYVRRLGADEAVDYHATRFEDVVRDADVVLDAIGGDTQRRSWQVLKPGGILVSIVGISSGEVGAARGVRSAPFMAKPNAAELAEIGRLIDAGQVEVSVETVLPLSEARKAHELSQSGHTRGKIVLQVT